MIFGSTKQIVDLGNIYTQLCVLEENLVESSTQQLSSCLSKDLMCHIHDKLVYMCELTASEEADDE